jgi:hypothetical protein
VLHQGHRIRNGGNGMHCEFFRVVTIQSHSAK